MNQDRRDWSVPKPDRLPRRTPWPAAAALGIVFILWGIITEYFVAGAGVALLGAAVIGWIGELRRDR